MNLRMDAPLARLFVDNPHPFTIRQQPVSIGVPLAQGMLRATDQLCLQDAAREPVPHAATVLSRWHDGSVRWVLMEWLAGAEPAQRIMLELTRADRPGTAHTPPHEWPSDRASDQDSPIPAHFDAGELVYRLESAEGQLLAMAGVQDTIAVAGASKSSHPSLELIDADDRQLTFEVVEQRWLTDQSGHRATLVSIADGGSDPAAHALRATVRQTFHTGNPTCRVEISLHNTQAALHPGGLWDLGDPGSFRFKRCALIMPLADDATVEWQLNAGDPWQAVVFGTFSITQASSGGDHWNSPVHVDAKGDHDLPFRGYEVHGGSASVITGKRCTPALRWCSSALPVTLRPESFWQSFPRALSVEARTCRMELFPAFDDVMHELQGGETTTSVFHLAFTEQVDALDWVEHPLQISLDPACVFRSEALGDWHDRALDERYSALLAHGIEGSQSFFAKREMIDEYGWRHFGELYADHETWQREVVGIFVSHYNNQYDAIAGFARQFLQTGDVRWFVLMRDLARHVLDIDLYRTDADRLEYNQGLFWHTDHYVQAHTATHRTYSRLQNPEHPESTGGGPGGQHCYTSGLRLYHQLTGDSRARDAVFDLARWMGFVYDGTGSMFEQARLSLKGELPTFLKLLRGQKVLRYRYPLDRGVGNYIRALLDCFELDGSRRHLDKAAAIIKETLGPADVIEERGLDDVEGTWFYTVLLQAVVSYLDVKRQAGQLDADFCYAHASLLHYARWMARHERPYLEVRERLEFPNDTWAAQDARKASVLHAAYRYSADHREPLLAAAKRFRDYVVNALEGSDTVHYTRIQAILLQNHGPVGHVWETLPAPAIEPSGGFEYVDSHATFGSHTRRCAKTWWHCLRSFSPRREAAWLKCRLPQRGKGESSR